MDFGRRTRDHRELLWALGVQLHFHDVKRGNERRDGDAVAGLTRSRCAAHGELMRALDGPDLCHCLSSRRSARLLARLYDRHLTPASINNSQFALLYYLADEPGVGSSELASKMAMARTTLVRALKPLRSAGLIETRTEKQPELSFYLTANGHDMLLRAKPLWAAAQAEYEAMVGAERAGELRGELLTLTTVLGSPQE